MTCNGQRMGFDFGLENVNTCFKRKNRWLFKLDGISASDYSRSSSDSIFSLPPSKSQRPNISFKEMEAQHLTETIYYPAKPEWKPITLSLYDIVRPNMKINPIFSWLKEIYDPQNESTWRYPCDGFKKPNAKLELYDGCGNILEIWNFESVWPQAIEFGDLDMSSSDVMQVDVTLRYDRAYIVTT